MPEVKKEPHFWNGKELSTLSNDEIIAAYNKCNSEEKKREEASKHEKFNADLKDDNGKVKRKKMNFAPSNPLFLKLKDELLNEINKRKLDVNNV